MRLEEFFAKVNGADPDRVAPWTAEQRSTHFFTSGDISATLVSRRGPLVQMPLKNIVKTSLYSAGYYHALRALRSPQEPRLLVLMYHDLLDDFRRRNSREIDDQSPDALQFEAQLREITRHYELVSLRVAVDRLRSRTLLKNSVAITFDDGYRSVYSVAYPILKKYRAPATVFLLTDWIDRGAPYWWHRVRDMIEQSPARLVPADELHSALGDPGDFVWKGPFDLRARRQLARAAEDRFRDLADEERDPRIERLERLLFPDGNYTPGEETALTWDQAREMADNGVDFEAHTCSHIDIRRSNPEVVEHEIASSKRAIEEKLDREVSGFAYPYGKDLPAYREIRELLRKHGIRWACTAESGLNSSDTDPYLLLRSGLPLTASRALLHRDLILQFSRSLAQE
jgi:peptidoglycan/xylan/chitin deacetylase (PgdA/CDA1 family)